MDTENLRSESPDNRPNILFVFTDQQHFNAVSAFGNPHLHTPSMDWITREGVRFTNCYATDPVCAPCRSSIFFGRMPCETGVYKNELWPLETLPTVGTWLSQNAGYRSVYCGKWHLFQSETFSIPGFEVIGTGANCEGNFTDSIITRACDAFLHSRTGDEPFFLVASYQQPHDICGWIDLNQYNAERLRYPEIAPELPPLSPTLRVSHAEPELMRERRENNAGWKNNWSEEHWRYYEWSYNRQVEMVDAEIGRLFESLLQSPHARNTVVIFTSDHGEGLGRHGFQGKSVLYDEAARLPFVIWRPGHLPQGATAHQLISALDFMPTVCGLAGISPPEDMRLGRSIIPFAANPSAPSPEFVVAACQANRGRMVRSMKMKYIVFSNDPVEMLFDMEADAGETVNLADNPDYSEELQWHRDTLVKWEREMVYAPGVPPFVMPFPH
ncbi:MAG: sulfatase-like hydrolase/transferase [Opitutales bacterium]|nr:sulfatase-like hydrolase/transferase [Opitutales bacterium]